METKIKVLNLIKHNKVSHVCMRGFALNTDCDTLHIDHFYCNVQKNKPRLASFF